MDEGALFSNNRSHKKLLTLTGFSIENNTDQSNFEINHKINRR